MTAATLVAGPVNTSSAFGGTGVVESVNDLCESLRSGSWVATGLAGVGAALDIAATVIDPLGSLIAAGLGWVMEHLEPLRGWLNDLAGDAGAVLGVAGTWQNVATAMGSAGDELDRVVLADLEAMSGESITAYAAYADGLAEQIRATGASASAMGSALQKCAMVVQVVHDLVRDTLAQLAGSIISWAAELVLTVGLATPVIVGQVTTRVSSLATRVGKSVTDVLTSAKSLTGLLDALKGALGALVTDVRRRLPGAGRVAPTPRASGALPPARSYRMADGVDHRTIFASEQLDRSHTAQHTIDGMLDDGGVFARHGLAPWTRSELADKVMTPVADLSAAERSTLREFADALPAPRAGDGVQKVVSYADAAGRLDPTALPVDYRHIQGSITRIEDSADLDSVSRLHTALRLDFEGSPFLPKNASEQVIRFRLTDDVAQTSRFSTMGGRDASTDGWSDPYTGNGFLKSPDLIPEYRIDGAENAVLPKGAEMWEVLTDGTQRLSAVLRQAGWVAVE